MSVKPWEVMNGKDYDTYKSNKYMAETYGDKDGSLNRQNSILRNNYGIDSDDYSYSDLQQQSAYGANPYDYAAAKNLSKAKKYAAYTDPYANEKYNLYNELSNFKYEPDNDELFKAYKDMYTREGAAARDKVYASLTSYSGGRNNSWASAAAAQAQNSYARKISDAAAELAQKAYDKLLNEYNILNSRSENEYKQNEGLYESEMEQYKQNKDMAEKYRENAQQQISDERDDVSNEIADRYKESQIAKNNQSMIKTQKDIEKADIELKYLTQLEQIKLQLGYLDIQSAQALIAQRKAQTQKTYSTIR